MYFLMAHPPFHSHSIPQHLADNNFDTGIIMIRALIRHSVFLLVACAGCSRQSPICGHFSTDRSIALDNVAYEHSRYV